MQAHELLNDEQRSAIVRTMLDCCTAYREYDELARDLFYEPYAHRRKRQSLTLAMLSSFAPGRFNVEGIEVASIEYGIGMMQPELRTGNAVLHIKSHTARSDTNDVKENCRRHNADLDEPPVFGQIVFTASAGGAVEQVQVVLYDAKVSTIDYDVFRIPTEYRR